MRDDDVRRRLGLSAASGAVVWLVAHALPFVSDVEIVIMGGLLVVTPMCLYLSPRVAAPAPELERWLSRACAPAATAGAASLLLAPGMAAGVLAGVWAAFTVVVARSALHLLPRGVAPAATALGAGRLLLAVGGAWLFADRTAFRPLDLDPLMVQLTAAHFPFVGLATQTLIALTLRARESAGAARGLHRTVVAGSLLGTALVAVGLSGAPAIAVAGAVMLTSALWAHAGLTLGVARKVPGAGPGWLLSASCAALLVTMPLACVWSISVVTGVMTVPMGAMVRLHGHVNAYGFAALGLLSWTWAEVAAARAAPVISSEA